MFRNLYLKLAILEGIWREYCIFQDAIFYKKKECILKGFPFVPVGFYLTQSFIFILPFTYFTFFFGSTNVHNFAISCHLLSLGCPRDIDNWGQLFIKPMLSDRGKSYLMGVAVVVGWFQRYYIPENDKMPSCSMYDSIFHSTALLSLWVI